MERGGGLGENIIGASSDYKYKTYDVKKL